MLGHRIMLRSRKRTPGEQPGSTAIHLSMMDLDSAREVRIETRIQPGERMRAVGIASGGRDRSRLR